MKRVLIIFGLGAACIAGYGRDVCEWYNDSYIHSHVSVNLKPASMASVREQIRAVRPDVIQFHIFHRPWWTEMNKRKLYDELNFKKVATINYAGTWRASEYDRFPELFVYRRNADGTFAGRWDKKHLCFNSPGVDEWVVPEKYNTLVKQLQPSQVWVDENIITVNLCYCDHCVRKYKEKYGQEPPRTLTDENWNDWEQWVGFHRETFEHWMEKVYNSVTGVNSNILVTFNHAYFVGQPEHPPAFIKNLSADLHHEPLAIGYYARYGGSGDIPFDIMPGLSSEFWAGVVPKTQEQVYNDISLIIAHGGRWNIGEFPTDRTSINGMSKAKERPVEKYLELAKKGAAFARERKEFCTDSRPFMSSVALLRSARTHYSYVIQNANLINTNNNIIADSSGVYQRNYTGKIDSRIYWPANNNMHPSMIGAYEYLLEAHVPFDFINEDQLAGKIGQYKLIVMPELTYLNDSTIPLLKAFVAKGGCILATGTTIQSRLADIFDISEIARLSADADVAVSLPDGSSAVGCGVWNVQAESTRVIRSFASSGKPLCVKNTQGNVLYIACDLFSEYSRRSGYSHETSGGRNSIRPLLDGLMAQIPCDTDVKVAAPPWFETVLREKGSSKYVHLINRSINWKNGFYETPDVIEICMQMDSAPGSVLIQPDNRPVDYTYVDNKLQVHVSLESVANYKILQINTNAGEQAGESIQ